MRNPVCNLATMVTISDIPDWCFVEAFGCEVRYMCGVPGKVLRSAQFANICCGKAVHGILILRWARCKPSA